MSPRFLSLWAIKAALRQSSMLIRIGSTRRIAGFAVAAPLTGKIEAVTTDSNRCSGTTTPGHVVNGLLLGIPG